MEAKQLKLFEAKYIPEPNSGCWIWIASLNEAGYGRFHQNRSAHRWAYSHYRGSIPNGSDLDHLCRVRCCVNPWHLEIVSRRTNLLRGVGPTAIHAQQTHCPKGHSYTGDNSISEADRGYIHRRCRTCKNERQFRRNRLIRGKEVTQYVPRRIISDQYRTQ